MKFELGFEKQNRDKKKAAGEKLRGMDVYKDFNCEPINDLLENRREIINEVVRRQKERIEELKKKEDDGELYIK